MSRLRYNRTLLASIAASGLVSLAAIALSIVSFRRAVRRGEEARAEQAGDLVESHKLAMLLERKLAKSRTFMVTGEETFAAEMEEARSDFKAVVEELRAGDGSSRAGELLDRIGRLEKTHHDSLQEVMGQRRRGTRPGALTPHLVDRLKPLRDELDQAVSDLIRFERDRLDESERAADDSIRFAQNASAAAGLVSCGGFFVVLWLARRLAAAQLQVEEALRRSNSELDALVAARTIELSAFNRELEAFSYSVAHDLRTPLRAVTNYAELAAARARAAGDEELRLSVERIRAAGLRMSQLIDALLSLSRLTRRPMSVTEVDLTALALEVWAEVRSAEPERRVSFTAEPGLTDSADPDLIRAVLHNLLDNAWKFTRGAPDAAVSFGRAQAEGTACYFVRDNGAGFDERFTGKLFTAFERLHPAEDFPGTGIGLATVERVIHRHGGSVWAEGRTGRGAAFYFTLNRRLPGKERARNPAPRPYA